MKINNFTNICFRALIFLALHPQRLVKSQEIADAYDISYNHLKKAVLHLSDRGYIKSLKGRNGGLRLAKDAQLINVGEVFKTTIEDVTFADCFASPTNSCVISPACKFRKILMAATQGFVHELAQYQLQDLVSGIEPALINLLEPVTESTEDTDPKTTPIV